jgi:hypothetical protein
VATQENKESKDLQANIIYDVDEGDNTLVADETATSHDEWNQ